MVEKSIIMSRLAYLRTEVMTMAFDTRDDAKSLREYIGSEIIKMMEEITVDKLTAEPKRSCEVELD